MPRYVDTDALIDDCMERYCKKCDKRKGIKNGKWRIIYEIGDVPCRACDVDDLKAELENAPTADVRENVHGEWLMSDESKLRPYMCSNCGCLYDVDTVMGKIVWQFCPNCGAMMKERSEDGSKTD